MCFLKKIKHQLLLRKKKRKKSVKAAKKSNKNSKPKYKCRCKKCAHCISYTDMTCEFQHSGVKKVLGRERIITSCRDYTRHK